MNKDKIRQVSVVIATLVMITINALADIIPINHLNTGAISNQFEVYFVPAGYVFSIWGLIYLGLLCFAIYQALPSKTSDPELRKIGWWYVFTCLANAVWILLWHYQYFYFTLLVMFLLVITLIIIYRKLGIGIEKVSRGIRYLVQVPFSIYLGWITVATIANATDVLYLIHWSGFDISQKTWAVIMMVVSVVIAELVAFNRRDLAFLAVLVWALIGIGQKFNGVSPIFESAYVAALAVVVMAIISITVKPKKTF
jgi:hypothetical protein